MTTSALPHDASKAGILARSATVLLLLSSALSLVTPAILAWLHFRFLAQGRRALVWLVIMHPIVRSLYWIRALAVASGFLCLAVWLYSVYRDLAGRGADTRYRPGWALGGFFVPVWNFVWPYLAASNGWRVASEFRSETESDDSAPRRATPLAIILWWALVLITVFLGTVGGRAVWPGQMELSAALVVWNLSSAASSLLAIAVISLIERERRSLTPSQPVALLGGRSLPVTGSVAGALAVLLVLLGVYGFSRWEMKKVQSIGSVGLAAVPPGMFPRDAWSTWAREDWQIKAEYGQGSVRVSWRRCDFPNVAGYNVYRRSEGSAVEKINRELVAQPTFEDGDIQPGGTYHYAVSAVDGGGTESARSVEASLTLPVSPVPENGQLREPTKIPEETGLEGGVEGGVPGGVVGGVLGEIKGDDKSGDAAGKEQPVRVSGAMVRPKCISSVDPVYPELAKQARIEGTVILDVTTDVRGRVESVKVLLSNPLLAQAAIDAVRQWVYEPLKIHGQPHRAAFNVNVIFRLR